MAKETRRGVGRYGAKKDPQLSLPTEELVVCQCEGAPKKPITIGEALEFRGKECQKKGLICCSPLRKDNEQKTLQLGE